MIAIGALLVGLVCACGLYLLLSRNLQRMAIGFLLLSNGINLLCLTCAGLPAHAVPPLIRDDASGPFSDPLAQAFILTAIVIGLGMAAFLLAIAVRFHRETGCDRLSEGFGAKGAEGDPKPQMFNKGQQGE